MPIFFPVVFPAPGLVIALVPYPAVSPVPFTTAIFGTKFNLGAIFLLLERPAAPLAPTPGFFFFFNTFLKPFKSAVVDAVALKNLVHPLARDSEIAGALGRGDTSV